MVSTASGVDSIDAGDVSSAPGMGSVVLSDAASVTSAALDVVGRAFNPENVKRSNHKARLNQGNTHTFLKSQRDVASEKENLGNDCDILERSFATFLCNKNLITRAQN